MSQVQPPKAGLLPTYSGGSVFLRTTERSPLPRPAMAQNYHATGAHTREQFTMQLRYELLRWRLVARLFDARIFKRTDYHSPNELSLLLTRLRTLEHVEDWQNNLPTYFPPNAPAINATVKIKSTLLIIAFALVFFGRAKEGPGPLR
jgi:hypothetical protein